MTIILNQNDGGMSSRKFLFAIGTGALIFIGFVLSAVFPNFGNQFGELIGGLLGCLGLYLGGNVMGKWRGLTQVKTGLMDGSVPTKEEMLPEETEVEKKAE